MHQGIWLDMGFLTYFQVNQFEYTECLHHFGLGFETLLQLALVGPERGIQSKLAFDSLSSRTGWCCGHVLTCSTTDTFQEVSRWGDRSTGFCKS